MSDYSEFIRFMAEPSSAKIYVYFKSHPSPQPSPHGGEGERGQISMLFKS
jgi:hypothetical protein